MSDYISREAIAKRLEEMEIVGPLYYGIPVVEALEAIREAPSADVRPVARGKWEKEAIGEYGQYEYFCSVCGAPPMCGVTREILPPFCPWCGADMREEVQDA